jgi:hypothetical protein
MSLKGRWRMPQGEILYNVSVNIRAIYIVGESGECDGAAGCTDTHSTNVFSIAADFQPEKNCPFEVMFL